MAKVVIIGGSGLLGSSLSEQFRVDAPEFDIAVPSRRELDLANSMDAAAILAQECPDVVINCAAYTDVDSAEAEPLEALAINSIGVRHLAQACREVRCHLVQMSTDYVFSEAKGTPILESTKPKPLSIYGFSKMVGEQWASDILGTALAIVRTSWLYAPTGKSFVARFAQWAHEDRPIEVEASCVSLPTSVADLASQIVQLSKRVAINGTDAPSGIYHFANSGPATKFEVARHVYSLLNADPGRVTPVTWEEIPHKAPRPVWSCLLDSRSGNSGMIPMRPWKQALRDCLIGD